MIFTSLQVLRNSYRFNYEPTNLLSKTNFAVYFLDYFYHTMLAKRMLNIMDDNITALFNAKIMKFKKRYYTRFTEMYTVDFYYFMGSSWCLLAFKIVEFTKLHPSVFRLKPLQKCNFVRKHVKKFAGNRHFL